MREKAKRAIALLLMAALMLTSVPMTALADETQTADILIPGVLLQILQTVQPLLVGFRRFAGGAHFRKL